MIAAPLCEQRSPSASRKNSFCPPIFNQMLTYANSTTTSTSTSTFWTITEKQPCSATSPALPKRAYGPYYSANATSTPTASGTGTGISLGTSASPVTESLGTTTDISQSYTIPSYATPCGIPYYYSSACSCLSITPTYVYETVPVRGVATPDLRYSSNS